MCSSFTDGAAAVVVGRDRPSVAGRWPGSSGRSPGRGAGNLDYHDRLTETSRAAYEAFGFGPEDFDMVELHDATSAEELFALESLGIFEPGRGRPGHPGRATPPSAVGASRSTRAAASSRAATRSARPGSPRWSRSSPTCGAGPAPGRSTGARLGLAVNTGGVVDGDAGYVGITAIAGVRMSRSAGHRRPQLRHRRPRQGPHQRRPGGPARHERRLDHRADRHPRAPDRRDDLVARRRGGPPGVGAGRPDAHRHRRVGAGHHHRRRDRAGDRVDRAGRSSGCGTVGAFDLNAGCSGFVYGLVVSAGLVATGADRVLLIGADTLSRITDWDDRTIAVLVGDGAGAVVLEAVEGPGNLLSHNLHSDGSLRHLLYCDHGGYLWMDGQEIFRKAVRVVVESAEQALADAGVGVDDIAMLVPHQANLRIIQAACQRLGIPEERTAVVIDRYGNTSSASIPLALDDAVGAGRVARRRPRPAHAGSAAG